ncbi:MAG TPA: SMP-30/gluconolactonase/LRE family protein [Caulobacteraceae bacterium]
MPSEPECVWNLGCELGEGPMWSAAERAVWFVDIKKRQIHRWGEDGETRSWDTPDQTGFVLPMQGGGFVAGVRGGLHRFDPESGRFEMLQPVEPDKPENRLNDGYVDARGRLWFGTMHDSEGAVAGSLYRWDGAGEPRAMDGGYAITNGPTVSPDGRTLYHTDTRAKVIYAFDLSADGELSNKREFRRFGGDEGNPDGPAIDSEGCVWTSQFGGWGVRRYSPSGELLAFVRFPCANITKVAFGGDDLRTVYATTARLHLSEEQRAAQPLAGGLFRFRVETPGLPQNAVRAAA